MTQTRITGKQIGDGSIGVDLAVDVTGTLPVPNGGTGATSLTGVVVGNGGSAMTALAYTTAATASTLAQRDANANLNIVNVNFGYATTATSGGTTTLTVASAYQQYFTGSANHTVTLPATSTLVLGMQFLIFNNSSGSVTVNASDSSGVWTLSGGTDMIVTCISTSDTSQAGWNSDPKNVYAQSGKAGIFNNTLIMAGVDGATMTFPATGTVVTTAATQAVSAKTLSDTFMGEAFDAQKTQRDTTLTASNDFTTLDVLEVAAATALEIPTTSSVEVFSSGPRRGFGQSVVPGASITVNTDAFEVYLLSSLGAAITVTLSGMGRKMLVGFRDDGTARAITWANAQSSGVATLLATTVINKTHWVGLVHDGKTWTCLAVDATGY